MLRAFHGVSCGCVWKCCVPLNPMVLLIIIPMKNGYFIGNIPYFQTNPCCFMVIWDVHGWSLRNFRQDMQDPRLDHRILDKEKTLITTERCMLLPTQDIIWAVSAVCCFSSFWAKAWKLFKKSVEGSSWWVETVFMLVNLNSDHQISTFSPSQQNASPLETALGHSLSHFAGFSSVVLGYPWLSLVVLLFWLFLVSATLFVTATVVTASLPTTAKPDPSAPCRLWECWRPGWRPGTGDVKICEGWILHDSTVFFSDFEYWELPNLHMG